MSSCECTGPGFCERHQCNKTTHWYRLCQRRPKYFELWEQGIGPGQTESQDKRSLLAPLRDCPRDKKPWEGSIRKKPWDFQITAVIPVLDTVDVLSTAVELLRLQTVQPFIVIIDTGSNDENLARIRELESKDLEVHSLRLRGVRHPSDFPAMAMDLAFAVCRTKYMFATHADCFLMRNDVLQELLELCCIESPVVGHQLSPREHEDWIGMVGHTCLMLNMEVMDEIGAGWSLRRLARRHGLENYKPDPMRPNWPDTELLLNYTLREHDIVPYLTGTEENHVRNTDTYIDHCRSLTAGLLYNRQYYEKAKSWADDAVRAAQERIHEWRSSKLSSEGWAALSKET